MCCCAHSRHALIFFLSALNLGQIQWQQLNTMADNAKAYVGQRSFIVYFCYVERYEPSGLRATEHEDRQTFSHLGWTCDASSGVIEAQFVRAALRVPLAVVRRVMGVPSSIICMYVCIQNCKQRTAHRVR